MGIATEREALRQRSVGDIFQAANRIADINYRESLGELTREQANALRAEAPYIGQKAQAEINLRTQQAAHAGASAQLAQAQATEIPSQIAEREARSKLLSEQARGVQSEIDVRKSLVNFHNAQAATQPSLARYHDALAAKAENEQKLLEKKLSALEQLQQQQAVPKTLEEAPPAGTTAEAIDALGKEAEEYRRRAKIYELSGEEGAAARYESLAQSSEARSEAMKEHARGEYEKKLLHQKEAKVAEEKRKTEAYEAEKYLLHEQAMAKPETVAGSVNRYHANSDDNFMYVRPPGTLYGLKQWTKYPIPPIPQADGTTVQYSARQMYDMAQKYGGGRTMQEYVEAVLDKANVPIPWKKEYVPAPIWNQ